MLDLTYDTPKPKVIAGAKHDWELVIGMEIHAQVASKAKLFSGASTAFGYSALTAAKAAQACSPWPRRLSEMPSFNRLSERFKN